MQRPSLHRQGPHALGDQDAGLDRVPRGDDRRPSQMLQAALGGEMRRDFAEKRGLQLGKVGQEPGHAACGVMLGQPVGGRHVREDFRSRLVTTRLIPVLPVPDDLPDWVVLLPVDNVGERGFLRLVVRGQRTVYHAGRREQPCLSVRLHDERVDAGDRIGSGCSLGRPEGRRPVGHEVRHVLPGPLALPRVPPDQRLALAPRRATRVR